MANGSIQEPWRKVQIVAQAIPEFTAPANTAYGLNLSYTPPTGYKACYYAFELYRTRNDWVTHAKNISLATNDANIDFVNLSSQDIVVSNAFSVWLLLPN